MRSEATSQFPDSPDLGALSLERLEARITELAAHINAATCAWLGLVGEFDRREGWAQWGCRSCTHWLSYRCGLSPAAAREHLRVARLLSELTAIQAAFGRGELCYSQVRAITRVATAESEAQLVEIARHATAAQLETLVRAFRGVLEVELGAREPAHRRRYLRCRYDDDGSLLIAARLPAEEGALVLAALEAGRDALRERGPTPAPDGEGGSASAETTHIGDNATAVPARDGQRDGQHPDSEDVVGAQPLGEQAVGEQPEGEQAERERIDDTQPTGGQAGWGLADGERAGWGRVDGEQGVSGRVVGEPDDGEQAPGEREAVSNVDALLLMARTLLWAGLGEGGGADRYQVVVHVDAATLADDDDDGGGGGCGLDGGPALHPETARRLACDASVVRILERDGRPLSLGRRTRSVSPALRRALRSRDQSCRFPGCCARRFLHAHHVEHWARGGRTDLSNLIQLCRYHHRLVHEGGYTIERRDRGGLRFRRPDGLAIPAFPERPQGRRGELARRHQQAGLAIGDQTCVPNVDYQPMQAAGVVDGLAETDPRLRQHETLTQ